MRKAPRAREMKTYWTIMNKDEIAAKLRLIASGDEWLPAFCVNSDGHRVLYARTDEEVARAADVGVGLSVYTEDVAREAVQTVFLSHSDMIAEWILSKKPSIRLRVTFPNNVGYILKDDKSRIESNVVQVSIHREVGYNTKYGFFVSTVLPCCDVGDVE